jgi:dTDP-glucose 4,6-dehydratase
MISNALSGKPLPIYGDGMQVRDWLYVDDHCRALLALLERGRPGEIYNIGGTCALPNREVVRRILHTLGRPESLLTPVADRPGHDRRYAITSEKVMRETGWSPEASFDEALQKTIGWYQAHAAWIARIHSGEYRSYYETNYTHRDTALAGLAAQ